MGVQLFSFVARIFVVMGEQKTLCFLHTADWHLGKKLDRFSRLEEQKVVLQNLAKLADEQEVHAVLVAGDVFDSRNPSPEAKRLLTEELLWLSDGGKRPVILIAGNHDSPELLDALALWGAPLGILLVGELFQEFSRLEGRFGAGFELQVQDQGLILLAGPSWPFACQFVLSPYLSAYRRQGADASTFWKEHWDRILQKAAPEAPIVLLAHPYVSYQADPLEEDAEERSLALGGQEAISLEAFPEGLAYAALGHIHSPKVLRQKPYPVAYAGSLLQYSFGDPCQDKKALLVEVPRSGPARVAFLPEEKGLSGGYPLLSCPVTSVEEAEDKCQKHPEAYLEMVWVGQMAPSPDLRRRLDSLHPRLVRFRLQRSYSSGQLPDAEVIAQVDELDLEALFEAFYRARRGKDPDDYMKALLREVLKRAQSPNTPITD